MTVKGKKDWGTRVLLSLAALASAALLSSKCGHPPAQETVTITLPRAAIMQAQEINATTNAVLNNPLLAPGIETEAAGDALAHAIVDLKARRRAEALYHLGLARTRLMLRLNRTSEQGPTSNPARQHLISVLRDLDSADRFVRHNAYERGRAQLLSITVDLDQLP